MTKKTDLYIPVIDEKDGIYDKENAPDEVKALFGIQTEFSDRTEMIKIVHAKLQQHGKYYRVRKDVRSNVRSYAVFKCNCCGSRVQINFDLQKSGMFKIIVSRDSFPPSHCQTILSARNRKEIVSTLNSQEPINPTSKINMNRLH